MPGDVRGFIQDCIPHVDAAELLLILTRDKGRAFSVTELTCELKHSDLSEAAVEKYLATFMECGLIAREHGTYRLAPVTPEYDDILTELGRLYNEQPVTLVRMIYAPKDDRLRAFADAFKIKK